MIISCSYLSKDGTVHNKAYVGFSVGAEIEISQVTAYCHKHNLPVVVFEKDYDINMRKPVEENINEATIAAFVDLFKRNEEIHDFDYIINKSFEDVMSNDVLTASGIHNEEFEETIKVFGIEFTHYVEFATTDTEEDLVIHHFMDTDGDITHHITKRMWR